MTEVEIKSTLLDRNSIKPSETRRFTLNKSQAKNFDALRTKLISIYEEELENVQFRVYWEDEDGDEIRISTNDELVNALRKFKDKPFKITVKKDASSNCAEPGIREILPSADSRTFAARPSGVHHPGVICDSCNGGIYGFRYKCTQCFDFDLCSDCEQRGSHAHHRMLRISTPARDVGNDSTPLQIVWSSETVHFSREFGTF